MAPNADGLVCMVNLGHGSPEKRETGDRTGATHYPVDQLIEHHPPPHLEGDHKNNMPAAAEPTAGSDDIKKLHQKTTSANVEDIAEVHDADDDARVLGMSEGHDLVAEAPKKKKKKKKSKAARGIVPVSGFEGT